MYLNEVGVESRQQHSFNQLILVAVLIVERSVTLALTGTRNQLSIMQVLTELRDETCNSMTRKQGRFCKEVNK